MKFKEWMAAMLGHRPHNHVDHEVRIKLDAAEGRMAGRLSRLTGKRRDEVMAETYRRADKILAGRAVETRK